MLERHPDELLADFQETYRIDLWAMGLDGDELTIEVRRAAVLAAQLPRTSRVVRAMVPTAANGTVEQLLRQIELNQRIWSWSHTKDAENKVNQPVPMTLPGEDEAHERKERQAQLDAAAVAAAFNLRGGDTDG